MGAVSCACVGAKTTSTGTLDRSGYGTWGVGIWLIFFFIPSDLQILNVGIYERRSKREGKS